MALARKTIRIYHHHCHLCGEPFSSESPCSKFCKPAHKQRMLRWRQHLPALVAKMIGDEEDPEGYIQQICFYLDFPEQREAAIQALSAISKEITNQLNLHNIRRVK
jgi:hypothetical protein